MPVLTTAIRRESNSMFTRKGKMVDYYNLVNQTSGNFLTIRLPRPRDGGWGGGGGQKL